MGDRRYRPAVAGLALIAALSIGQAAGPAAASTASPQAPTATPIPPPALAPGEVMILVDGQPTRAKVVELQNGRALRITGDGWTVVVDAQLPDGSDVPLAPDGSLVIAQGGPLRIVCLGFEPNSLVAVNLFSDPQLLGIVPVSDAGVVRTQLGVPSTVPTGAAHTLEMQGTNQAGKSLTLFLSATVKSPAAAKGAHPRINMRVPAVKAPGSRFVVTLSGVQANCPVRVFIKGSVGRTTATSTGLARATLVAPTQPGRYEVSARVSGSGCDPVTVSGTTAVSRSAQ